MAFRTLLLRALLPLLAASWIPAAPAAAPCEGFKWDVADVRAIFAGEPLVLAAGRARDAAPLLETGRLYALQLAPQEAVSLIAPPAKKTLADGAAAGLARVRVAQAGRYRIALDLPFWIDVLADGESLPSLDFNGDPACSAPRKIVVYALPAGEIWLQLSGHAGETVRLSVTAAP